jgi:uncharacterized membrane protein
MSLLPAAGMCYTVNTVPTPVVGCRQVVLALKRPRKGRFFTVSDDCGQSLFLIAYPGKETAAEVYHTLRVLEKQDQIDIKTAATINRREDGKLQLRHRQRLTLWKDEFDVEAIGLVLAATRSGTLAGALVGALMGSHRCFEPCELHSLLEDKVGPDDSALLILVTNADWEAVQCAIDHFGGEELTVELTAKAEKKLAEIASDEKVAAAVRELVEIEEVTL